MIDEDQIQRLAAQTNALRPDWPTKSLATFIGKHFAQRAYRDVAVALAWVACTDTETPRLVLEAGPWWRAATVETGQVPRNPKPHEECGQHPGQYRLSCSGCAGDRKAKRDEARAEQEAKTAASKAEAIEAIRASLSAGRERLCAHGVDRSLCADHDPRRNPATEEDEQ